MGVKVNDYTMFMYEDRFFWSRMQFEKAGFPVRSILRMVIEKKVKLCKFGDVPAKIAWDAGAPWAIKYLPTGECFHSTSEMLAAINHNRQWIYNHPEEFARPEPQPTEKTIALLQKYFKYA